MSGAGDTLRDWHLLIGTDAGYSPLVRAALDHCAPQASKVLVLFGADDAFPFRLRPSTILVPGMPPGVIASIPPLEEAGIASRLASTAGLPGCYDGQVTELAELWLRSLEAERVRITASGADTTLRAVEKLSLAFKIPITNIPT